MRFKTMELGVCPGQPVVPVTRQNDITCKLAEECLKLVKPVFHIGIYRGIAKIVELCLVIVPKQGSFEVMQ